MLRTITAEQYDEWIAYYRLEPWGIEMWDWLMAHFKALFANANRDTKKRKRGFKPDEFLCFGGRKHEVTDIDDGIPTNAEPSDTEQTTD